MIVYSKMAQILSFVLAVFIIEKEEGTYGIADPGFGYIDPQGRN